MTVDFTLLAVNFKHGYPYSVLMCKCKNQRSNRNLKEHLQAHQGLRGAQDNPKKRHKCSEYTHLHGAIYHPVLTHTWKPGQPAVPFPGAPSTP